MNSHLRIGRFEVIRELGRGAQSVVYLARDPHLEREVAIKTLHFSRPDPQKNKQLLVEARTVSPLRHPNIVPIFEAGEEKGDLYLVFEYVAGENLADFLKRHGALTPVRALAILMPVLDAIAHAHAAGIVHRDLKPSNILIASDGTPRVMDFGIAARSETLVGEQPLLGTPCYMAPEYLEHRQSTPLGDIFAAGLVLYEMLVGRRAITGNSVHEIVNKLVQTDVRLPETTDVDERLVAIVHKALARQPELRYQNARQMREALDEFLEPEAAPVAEGARQSTIEFLLRRMRHKSDFPALSESVSTINKIAASDRESVANLSSSILRDFSLTNKILRLVNSAYFRQAGGGNISTISRAVLVLGFDAVRDIAITVMLFEHLKNKTNANQLKEEFLLATLAGILARDIGQRASIREVEQVFICAMFHRLGRLLCQFYFPDETEEVRRVIEQKKCSEDAATVQVLGLSYEELGIGIAQSWGFPQLIVGSMRRVPAGTVRKASTTEERMRVLSSCANELCVLVAEVEPAQRARTMQQVVARFRENLQLGEQALGEAVSASFKEVAEFAGVVGINLKQSAFAGMMVSWGGKGAGEGLSGQPHVDDTAGAATVLDVNVPKAALEDQEGDRGGRQTAEATEAVLLAGIQDISNTLVEDFKLNDLLRIILETMYRAKGFRRVILCIRDPRENQMLGRYGFGPDAPELSKRIAFPLSFSPDIFHAALSKGVDILISDTGDPKIKARIPDWYRKWINAGTFVIFPLCIRNVPVAMIYADSENPGDIEISERELSLLRTLRNQAVLAIKQSG